MAQRHPRELALALAGADAGREQQPFSVELLHHRARGPGPLERVKQVAQRVLHAGVGIEGDVPGRVIDQADGERHLQLAAAGLGQLIPPRNRARMKCSSASLIVPLRPSSRRSLKSAGS